MANTSKVKLYQFKRAFGLPNVSAFCVKLEFALLFAKIDYEVIAVSNPRKSPKGKIPYIVHDGKKIADSELAIQYLEKTFSIDFYPGLSLAEKAVANAFSKMLEEHFCFILLYDRWVNPDGWKIVKKIFFGKMPLPLRLIAEMKVRKYMKTQLHMQGIGRHSLEEIHKMGKEDIDSVVHFLGDKQYFIGDKPTRIDGLVYGTMASIVKSPFPTPLRAYVQNQPKLIEYCDRVEKAFFSTVLSLK